MNEVKTGTDWTLESTHDVLRNSSLKLEDRDRLPSKVVQDIDLVKSPSSKFPAAMILPYLVIPPTDSQISASGVPGNTADPEPWVLCWTECTL
jgi:hypothetical protein